jgi:hypothetical protein
MTKRNLRSAWSQVKQNEERSTLRRALDIFYDFKPFLNLLIYLI